MALETNPEGNQAVSPEAALEAKLEATSKNLFQIFPASAAESGCERGFPGLATELLSGLELF